jgi:multisubunit Na+/H+ antiporter MnhB subunit
MRYRDKFMFVGTGVVLLALFLSDPDGGILQNLPFGGSTIAGLLVFSKAILALAFAHYGRKALFDYPEGDFQTTAAKALEGSTGAGLLAIAYAVVFFGLVGLFGKGL